MHLIYSAAFASALPELRQEGFDILLGGPDEQLVPELAEILAEEVERLLPTE